MDCNVQGSPEKHQAKKPCKGILKTSSSFDKHSVSQRRKSTKFDELNVMQTYHPVDKDYGHMKVEEPKTPYNYANPDDQILDQIDADVLAERLKVSEPRKSLDETDDADESSEEDERSYETPEEKQRRLDFEKRRKLHYNEFEALKLARKLMEEEEEEDDDGTTAIKNDDQSQQASVSGDKGDGKNEVEMDNDNS
ncbi:protein phosphatase inhibitor 2 [Sitodiplosis mosellana]|uniref:protein phosphatase inhibitor 2 n=1 Tax=Sitodiplosis mosellana TaxID=263140 RepID=UPI002444BBDC|nr:protein phosphatase inhibitor 2 [Sitodiplosis mosellana]XP_055315462.1 protein phosphatase inhibitor 2 [Sitodiplosis mosellana]XP_055315463.1 protein phosphatase inhibitor 2 [Sitodiplosis mosellana]